LNVYQFISFLSFLLLLMNKIMNKKHVCKHSLVGDGQFSHYPKSENRNSVQDKRTINPSGTELSLE